MAIAFVVKLGYKNYNSIQYIYTGILGSWDVLLLGFNGYWQMVLKQWFYSQ